MKKVRRVLYDSNQEAFALLCDLAEPLHLIHHDEAGLALCLSHPLRHFDIGMEPPFGFRL